ncbi:cytochrome C, partial [bacterium]|nr:cytochrome C [bacterium]
MTEDKNIIERGLWRNPMSYLGIAMSAVAALLIALLLIIDMLAAIHSPYLGVLLFFIMPVFFMAGFVLLAWGMWDEHKRRRKSAIVEIPEFPILDLNLPGHRTRFLVFIVGAAFTALFLTVIAYEAYHFTESLTFCGELCHEVMEPEAVSSQNSPHARVSCAGCHV